MSGAGSRCPVAQTGKEVIPLKEGNKGDNTLNGKAKEKQYSIIPPDPRGAIGAGSFRLKLTFASWRLGVRTILFI